MYFVKTPLREYSGLGVFATKNVKWEALDKSLITPQFLHV